MKKIFALLILLFSFNIYADDIYINNRNFRADDNGLFYYTSQTKDQILKPFKEVYISSESDFPDAVGGVITFDSLAPSLLGELMCAFGLIAFDLGPPVRLDRIVTRRHDALEP